MEQITRDSGTRDRSTKVEAVRSSVFPSLSSDARSAPIKAELQSSAAADALPIAPLAQGVAAREALTPENSESARDVSVSAATGASSNTEAPAVSSPGRETTLAPPADALPVAPLAQRVAAREALTPENSEPARDVSVSAATGASSNTEAPAVISPGRETTLAPPATGSGLELESGFPVSTTAATPPASPRPAAAEVAEVLARGDSFILIGDIASARVFYKRAADARDRRAALRLGATFDPAFLSRVGLSDTLGDPAQARSWYRRAFDLDATKPQQRRNGVDRR